MIVLSQAALTGGTDWLRAGRLIEVKRYFLNQVVRADHGPADDDRDTTIQHLRMDVDNCFVQLCNFI